ncbi:MULTISPECIES: N-acetyltransferase [Pseudovibrio]|uniref:GNAT family N-acetyltransferase n=1 Tax=Stappiaceae TaxID=2821832 RepID=UPI0029C178E4|nr:N-acetyltransferase [Pseudovibrio sp. SPO723]MDX5595347.1 N-acetyltransferase [Pseudovibrio sp. SPO723]
MMLTPPWFIRQELPQDDVEIDLMQEEAFGPGRFARTAFRIREGASAAASLSFVGLIDGVLAGSVRLTPIMIGTTQAMLLGPLTVSPSYKNRGLGKALMATAHEAAKAEGVPAILLIGDAPYYGPLGYQKVPEHTVELPGPFDPDRLLILMLQDGPLPFGHVKPGHDH